MRQFSLLLVDDSHSILTSLTRLFKTEGYKILTAGSAAEAMEILRRESVDVCITDENMPQITGTELLKAARVHFPNMVRIMLTGQSDIHVAQNAINNGEIYRFFVKPWDDFELITAVRHALALKMLEEENSRLKEQVRRQEEIIGRPTGEHGGFSETILSTDGTYEIEEKGS